MPNNIVMGRNLNIYSVKKLFAEQEKLQIRSKNRNFESLNINQEEFPAQQMFWNSQTQV